jgi:hypothetical protein
VQDFARKRPGQARIGAIPITPTPLPNQGTPYIIAPIGETFHTPTAFRPTRQKRRPVMGDKKSKKDKNKSEKQKANKLEKMKEEKKNKQPKRST